MGQTQRLPAMRTFSKRLKNQVDPYILAGWAGKKKISIIEVSFFFSKLLLFTFVYFGLLWF